MALESETCKSFCIGLSLSRSLLHRLRIEHSHSFATPEWAWRRAQAWGSTANLTCSSGGICLLELSAEDLSRADLSLVGQVLLLVAFRPPSRPFIVSPHDEEWRAQAYSMSILKVANGWRRPAE